MSNKLRVAINGFGRIGRTLLRVLEQQPRKSVEVVAINAPGDMHFQKHLLEYDSVHGRCKTKVHLDGDKLCFNNHKATMISEREIEALPWHDLGVDLILECTGAFRNKDMNLRHLDAGASKVLVSAPCNDADITVVYGVNHDEIREEHKIVSSASCTTNCLVPLAKVLEDNWGIEKVFINTVHSYTSDQALVDRYHKDPRRGRAAGISIVPTTTGATSTSEIVLPALKGKIQGSAVRVPTANVSLLDMYAQIGKEVTIGEIKQVFVKAAQEGMKNVLSINNLPLVSVDFNGNDASCILDLTQAKVMHGDFLHLAAWYDNEWGFCQRMWDTCAYMHDRGYFRA